MRYLILAFCVSASACAVSNPVSPSSAGAVGRTGVGIPAGSGNLATSRLQSTFAIPFKGDLHASEAVDGSLHHLTGSGRGTQLGAFTYAADIRVDDETGDGSGNVVWTAANGDQITASTTGAIVDADFANGRIVLAETQTVTGGTGRFENASGSITVRRVLNFFTGQTAGSFTGSITLSH